MSRCCSNEVKLARPNLHSAEALGESLREQGLRLTEGRRAILQVLFSARQPLSLPEIEQAAGAIAKKKPDYATVFRLLTLLEELGVVHKVNVHKTCSYFELHRPGQHYDHLICETCGKVALLELPCPVRETETYIRQHFGYTQLHHSLEFFGLCPDCQKNSPKSAAAGGA